MWKHTAGSGRQEGNDMVSAWAEACLVILIAVILVAGVTARLILCGMFRYPELELDTACAHASTDAH